MINLIFYKFENINYLFQKNSGMLPITLIIFLTTEIIYLLTIVWEPFMVLIPYAFCIILSIFVIFILWEIIKDINEIRKYINISTQTYPLMVESSTQTDSMESTEPWPEPWPESTEPWPE